ncbi:MAG: helix-turn-helix transcriptional regulator [Rhodoferax sp.]
MPDPIDAALQGIYRAVRGVPSPAFKDAALAALRAQLPFDAAGWGTFAITPQGAQVHSVHLVDLPMAMMADYEAVKQHDTLSARALARPGTTRNVSLRTTRWPLHPDMVAHVRRWGLDHSLGTVSIDTGLQLCNAISLYRGDAQPPFTPAQRLLKQRLMPHLVEAWNLNALMFCDRPSDGPARRHLALVDAEGMIHNADAGLQDLLQTEFAGWAGPQLPAPLVACLCGSPSATYRGRQLAAAVSRSLEDGFRLVRVRPLSAADQLSAREQAVAARFAAGSSYKEIAQALGVSPATVRNQLQNAYAKLGVRSKVALARALQDAD